MITRRLLSLRTGAVGTVLAAGLLVAGCGSSSSSHTTSASASNTKPASSGSSGGLTISTASGSAGTYLVGASGRALYLWVADHNGKSSCSGACAQNWPPVTASTMPKTAGKASASDLGTTTRSDGSKQLTYKGHPLYYFIGDSGPNSTSGQGSDGFGAKWWLVSPSGSAIQGGGSGGGGGGGYGGSSGY